MGLFKKENCPVCGDEIGILTRTGIIVNGSHLCGTCAPIMEESGLITDEMSKSQITKALNLGKQKLQDKANEKIRKQEENLNRLSNFTPTVQFSGYIWFDDNHKWFVFPHVAFVTAKIDNCFVFKYDEILDFEVLEDGTSITKGGFGKALVGGAIFGLAGAIAGGTSKKTKQICTTMQIKITTRNEDYPVMYVNMLNGETKKDSFVYKQISKEVQDILSKFQIIIDQLEREKSISNDDKNTNTLSVADEIKKYKELLDMGAISQEEFDKKKRELLNL